MFLFFDIQLSVSFFLSRRNCTHRFLDFTKAVGSPDFVNPVFLILLKHTSFPMKYSADLMLGVFVKSPTV